MMSVSDWISIICAGVALIVTVIIAVLQIRQSNCMERFEKRQDKRDEQRHQESVKAQAVSFISKYYKDRGLIPLCAIATMYNDLFYYKTAIGVLYAVAYTLKMSYKTDYKIDGFLNMLYHRLRDFGGRTMLKV